MKKNIFDLIWGFFKPKEKNIVCHWDNFTPATQPVYNRNNKNKKLINLKKQTPKWRKIKKVC